MDWFIQGIGDYFIDLLRSAFSFTCFVICRLLVNFWAHISQHIVRLSCRTVKHCDSMSAPFCDRFLFVLLSAMRAQCKSFVLIPMLIKSFCPQGLSYSPRIQRQRRPCNDLKLGARWGFSSSCTSPSNLMRWSPSAANWNRRWPFNTRPAHTPVHSNTHVTHKV